MKSFDKIIETKNLASLGEKHKGKKIGFCSGCFDVLHSGHAVFFEQCKEIADILVVSLGSDSILAALKGVERPVNPEKNRLYLLASMGNVDYVVLGGEAKDIKPGKIDFYENIKALKPDIFILNDDDSGLEQKKKLCQELGVSIKLVKREVPEFLKKISSTEIINKIKSI